MNSVLVINSEQDEFSELKTLLEFIECETVIFSEENNWKAHLAKSEEFAAVLIADSLGEKLVTLARELKAHDEGLPLILLSREKNMYSASPEVMGHILKVLTFPLKYQKLNDALQQALVFRQSHNRPKGAYSPELFRSLVGNSRGIKTVRKLIEQVSTSNATALILGESGTGKEVVARNIHYNSERREKAFVPINCGAIPADLLESELFGHEKGAFTGAISTRHGRFEMAEGGTLFLDEIGDMTMHMQVKLLRVLQERNFSRVGSNKIISTDVRIIAATHRNLEKAIEDGKFREDLFYRLNVFPIEMPPLRDRVEDISLLVNELLTRLECANRGSVRLTQAAISALCQYHWPGNVRELANLIERLVIMYPFGVVDVHDLPDKFQTDPVEMSESSASSMPEIMAFDPFEMPRLPREGIDLKQHLTDLECNLIKQAMEDAGGVVAHAANRLKLRRTTLVEKLRKYGLQRTNEVS